ncbi:hypothetical protein Bca4012_052991 [Brassica carinata]|uniref:COBRA C-terminal domain-containing protein n=1 Tax=Brassica carinata TaxID=52824 RepID=A0A8X7RCQ9_BRACI|nr:hypothetical protein Bca52824_055533 [Brassica carinata]
MKWDVMRWTPDGYVAIVTMFNFQKYRHRRKSYGSRHTALSLCCVSPPTKKGTVLPPLVQCTRHLCPIRVHWHVKQNYKSRWNMVAQHPNLDNITQIFSFNYKSLTPYAGLNDTAMLWGVKFYNDFLSEAGPLGNVQSEILFRMDQATFTFEIIVSCLLVILTLFFPMVVSGNSSQSSPPCSS